jgi:hypothetical protein
MARLNDGHVISQQKFRLSFKNDQTRSADAFEPVGMEIYQLVSLQ